MGIQYYAFTLFIAGLVCLIAILIKFLFADVRRQQKLLDEKETKILHLYNSVESLMDEITDQAMIVADEMKEYERRIAMRSASIVLQTDTTIRPEIKDAQPVAHTMAAETAKSKAINEVYERTPVAEVQRPPAKTTSSSGMVFQSFFDESIEDFEHVNGGAKPHRNDLIVAMSKDGRTDAQIAHELGITQNEVRLVIDLMTSGR